MASDFKVVRMIYGRGADAKDKYGFIPSGGMNDIIKGWHEKQEKREYDTASPSRITTCPRVIWLKRHGVQDMNTMGWGIAQRLMLGRKLEDIFAMQLNDAGVLLKHWQDNPGDVVEKFYMGEGLDALEGVPDYILKLDDKILVSDAKTSRSDSFGYVAIEAPTVWEDWGWYKYRLQLTAYFMLCRANAEWFAKEGIPMPTLCHLFSYALDDGIVRREFTWEPTEADMQKVKEYTRRFNQAVLSKECPACTCGESFDGFDVKFCDYGIVENGAKIATSCCSDDLIAQATLTEGEKE